MPSKATNPREEPHAAETLRTEIEMARRQVEQLQASGAEILKRGLELAADLGLEPFLLFGTLLGCIRDGGFVRGDHDIDLCLLTDDVQKLMTLEERGLSRGFQLRRRFRFRGRTRELSLLDPATGLWIDFSVMQAHGETVEVVECWPGYGLLVTYTYPAIFFRVLRRTSFAGSLSVLVPSPPERVLKATYGPDWGVPVPTFDRLRDYHCARFEPFSPSHPDVKLTDSGK